MYRYQAGKADWFAAGLPREGSQAHTSRAADVAIREVPTCRLGDHVRDLVDRARATGADACVVIDDERVVLGLLSLAEAQTADAVTAVEDVMDAAPPTVRPNLPAGQLPDYRKQRVERAVVTTCDGVLVGLLRPDASRASGS